MKQFAGFFVPIGVSVLILLTAAEELFARAKDQRRSLSSRQREVRLDHAKELLGKYYKRSEAKTGEKVQKINDMIYKWTFRLLPKKHKKNYQKIAQTIIDQSLKYGFDPVFLISVIMGESSFNPDSKGGVGELGLMQVRPETGRWIAQKYDLEWKGHRSLKDPVHNIKIGAAYLHFLRERFNSHARLYLAAYNMGQRNVDLALERSVWPKIYPAKVMKHYIDFYTELSQPFTEVATENDKPLKVSDNKG